MIGLSNIFKLFLYDWFGVNRRSSRREFICRLGLMWFFPNSLFVYMEKMLNRASLSSLSQSFYSYFILLVEMAIFLILFVVVASAVGQLFYVIHRRIHDLEFTGWWQLLILTPIAPFLILVLTLIRGTKGANKYGKEPEF